MPQGLKYPLTLEAKESAKQLVAAWKSGNVDQTFYLIDVTSGNAKRIEMRPGLGADDSFAPPALGVLHELAEYRLIRLAPIRTDRTERLEVTLLQELQNAVEHDFDVSDFFLTTSAVGTIVYGNLEVREGAVFQSAAAGIGNVYQNIEQLADELSRILGDEVLQNEPALKAAIVELRSADELTRLQKMGNVVQELGRGLGHLGNTGAAILALEIIARFLS
ncbi:MAG: hypothetical protein K8L97_08615 [Anaerolineae bacterium]|nr:hypothetical protein [Anaerolineae bacterium]